MPCGSKDFNHQEKDGENGHCAFQDLDHSILQHSFNLGTTNVKQILKCVQNGSKEVKDIILNECNIIYECKVCANLFRSLANFLYHKRCYCKKHLCEGMLLFENFEEDTQVVTVQPEPPDEHTKFRKESDSVFEMVDCTVDLVKTDATPEKNLPVSNDVVDVSQDKPNVSKEKVVRGKGNKIKEKVDDDTKRVTKGNKIENPMISRRTREKNSINASKRALKSASDPEPPKKSTKSTNKVNAVTKVSFDSTIEIVKSPEKPRKENKEHKKQQEESSKSHDKPMKEKDESIKKHAPLKESNESMKKSNEFAEESYEPIKESNEPMIESNEPMTESSEPMIDSNEPMKETDESMEESDVITLPETEQSNILVTSVTKETKKPKLHAELECGKSSKQMYGKAFKKIVITKPKSADLKNSNVFDNFRKSMKSNKIGFTNITNAAGKNLQCFPKIIFKTIDGNPHAVFQSTDNAKSENITFKSKFESSMVQSKADNEKLIIVLKKESSTSTAEHRSSIEKCSKTSKNQNEFHLTRRKRLLARSDCNVHELKCLNCNTQFTSLKTLYFHMLSIHSKKRLYYPCPFCKTLFVQMYGVTRHLVSIHNKTKEQINKLRDVIKKKSVWKKVDDMNVCNDEIRSEIKPEDNIVKEDPKPEIKKEDTIPITSNNEPVTQSVFKLGKNVTLHQCSKCGRVFGRKSSQVSHEKFCIMNAIKVETVDLAGVAPISPPPNVSFLSLSPKKNEVDPFHKPIQQPPSDIKVSSRPKRGAEKQMHKDFVNSQTLKWRSANRVDTNSKAAAPVKKHIGKKLEKKVMNIMNVENLLCMKCDKTFSSYSNLRRHVAIHVGWTRFKCKHCEYQAYNKSQCWAHVQKAHAVPDEDLEKSVVNISSKSLNKKSSFSVPVGQLTKHSPEVKIKQSPTKMNGIPKVKISKKKTAIICAKPLSEKKHVYLVKKGNSDKKDDSKRDKSQNLETKKEVNESKKEKIQNLENKKDIYDSKKEKGQNSEGKKETQGGMKRDKSQNESKKEDMKRDKCQNLESKGDLYDVKKERSHSLGTIVKFSVPEYKKESSSYKSVTTNNPTTIILSKKFPTVQSFVTLSPESMSSTTSGKTFPLRSSTRKNDAKEPGENSLTSLVTRSSAYTKSGPITIKMPGRSNSTDELKKSPPPISDKTYVKKNKLISEWFPKKELNSNNARRESAPLIIGLVPAANTGVNARAKSPAISYERNC